MLSDLTGISIAETIKGIQDAGVISCAKHFIGNEQVRSLFSNSASLEIFNALPYYHFRCS
jgi:beta-glucosidase-like glycosyl hydrolase